MKEIKIFNERPGTENVIYIIYINYVIYRKE